MASPNIKADEEFNHTGLVRMGFRMTRGADLRPAAEGSDKPIGDQACI